MKHFMTILLLIGLTTSYAQQTKSTPSNMTDKLAIATFGGGCFWCTEAVFQRVKGVE